MSRVTMVKLGGSLFDWEGLPRAWLNWRQSLDPTEMVWVVPGGGLAADSIRKLQRVHKFADSIAHHMAIDSMLLLKPYFLELFATSKSGNKWRTEIVPLKEMLANLDQLDGRLPEDWSVTSDAITLRLADGHQVKKVVFLKSVGPKSSNKLDNPITRGWVDAWTCEFGRQWLASHGMEFEWVNLRRWLPKD